MKLPSYSQTREFRTGIHDTPNNDYWFWYSGFKNTFHKNSWLKWDFVFRSFTLPWLVLKQHHQIDNCWFTGKSLNSWIDFEMHCTYLSHHIHAKSWSLSNPLAKTCKNLFFITSFISKLNHRGTNIRIDHVGTLCSWVLSKLRLQENARKCRKWWNIWVLKPQPLFIWPVLNLTVTQRNRSKATTNELICATIELDCKWRHSLYTDTLTMTHMCT